MIIAILLSLVPFTQLGLSYYASVQTVMASILAARITPNLRFIAPWWWIVILAIACGMLISVVAPGATGDDLLRRSREVAFFVLIAAGLRALSGRSPFQVDHRTHFGIAAICGLLFVVTVLQFLTLSRGAYFGLPPSLYVANSATLPDLLDLRYSHIRPFGTFGEPSYLAFVLLSLFVAITPALRHLTNRMARNSAGGRLVNPELIYLSAGAIAFSGLLSQSLSFYLAFPALLYFGVIRNAPANFKAAFATVAIVGVALMLGNTLTSGVVDRLSSGSDLSVAARLLVPAQVVPEYIIAHPFGTPFSNLVYSVTELSSQYGLTGVAILQNAFLNMFFNYGVGGIACIVILITAPRNIFLGTYVVFCTMFNGSIFSVDKFAIIVLCTSLYRAYSDYLSGRNDKAGLRR